MDSPKASRANPLAFTPWPVTLITAAVYLAFVIPLLVVHHVVPSAPSSSPYGLNLTEAWSDLQALTEGYRPYNSRQNDKIHDWLLQRINEILDAAPSANSGSDGSVTVTEAKADAFVFDDAVSNLTFTRDDLAVYFEGTNILVYIRGEEDDTDTWWEVPEGRPKGKGGVLVNAHYDSVSTGYGATDDGVGVVTCLQLIRYFMTPGHAPRRGLVVLFNNGEEDFLNGARVYSQHPLSRLPHTFLNLEGAGAGGRAVLFRSSDAEVTAPYMRSQHPFGSVLGSDGFKAGLVRSQTDYVVFEGDLGLRGLDVAFLEPRARYHTDQDDTRHTSVNSLWHMLSTAVATTEGLVSDSSDHFEGPTKHDGKVPSGEGHQAVWFDLYGSTFVLFRLHTLFALSVTLLVVAPLVLLVTSIILTKVDKMYLFRTSARPEGTLEVLPLYGDRGFIRFPFLLGIPTAVLVGLAYLLTKVNPLIIHSSQYAVWAMMVSAWTFLAWFVSRVADFARPSAFHRVYTLTWTFVFMWVLLVIATVYQDRWGMAGSYFVFFAFSGTFLATWISYLELFSLPRKAEYANQFNPASRRPSSYGSRLGGTSDGDEEEEEDDDETPTESTSLLGSRQRTTFANYVRVNADTENHSETEADERRIDVYGLEQRWSASLPKWLWVLQYLLSAPITLILVGPLALLLTSTLYQTGQDGSSSLFIYLAIAILTAILLNPVLPYIHRYTYHIPLFLLAVFIGTLIYNLVAFPFSDSNRLKLYFIQQVDLDTGSNTASLTGVEPFVHDVAAGLPSAAGQNVTCDTWGDRVKCSWPGIPPHVVDGDKALSEWLSYEITKSTEKPNKAQITVSGQNTRACKLLFDTPVKTIHVADSAYDSRFPSSSPKGVKEIRLWSRTWENSWTVDLEWFSFGSEEFESLTGQVVCLWSDYNQPGAIPALDEVRQYGPAWVAVSKVADGLVEGRKKIAIAPGVAS
ncbi:M28 family metallopeptidase [Aspergillus stella-maris]|uniref:M28 family metallopeptidase n=1 Tax=Aspergillus stella-maris TaxID=1810926 RepID=UPI003CCD195F